MIDWNEARSQVLLREHERRIFERTDRMFAVLLALQWLAGIGAALWISPLTWLGTQSSIHIHVWAAIFLGGSITAFPLFLAVAFPGALLTRYAIAVAQMSMAALLIHLTGGRIETHFHIFGSLAFIAVYRDWRVLLVASAVVAGDHIARGLYWPQSVYGVAGVEPWRWLEHAGWVFFEDLFLIVSIFDSRREMREIAERQARLEGVNETVEREVLDRTAALRESDAALRVALDDAKASERLKSEFLASMSHEIRTPLNGVIGMTGLLFDTPLSDTQREYASSARAAADHLLGLINDILDFSKIEAGKLTVEPVPFDLEVAAEEVAELFGSQLADKGLNLVLRYAPQAPRRVIGDPGRIRQVLTNLVGNAIKFTQAGQVFINIDEESHDATTSRFRFAVEDTGVGIEPGKQASIFRRFTQADASTTRRFGGTGLGLAISKQLVELMGGSIGVSSSLGVGSTFWFTLPLERDGESAEERSLPELANVRVLIVDENEVNRRVHHELITRWGMRIGEFASATEALTALRSAHAAGDPFQMALVDVGIDGNAESLGHAVKADPDLRDTVLVLLTTSVHAGNAPRMAADAGYAAFLTKPVRPSILMDAFATAWGAHLRRRETALITRSTLTQGGPRERTGSEVAAQCFDAAVLLVEDNVINQRVARLILEKLGCRVDLAANGKEAVEMVRSCSYDLVLMDCQMPEMDGYLATGEIRRLEAGRHHVPIVAMTAQAMLGDREKCLDSGMDDYMTKPVRREVIATVLERWLAAPVAPPPAAKPAPDETPGLEPEMVEALRSFAEDGGEDFVVDLVERFVRNTQQRVAALTAALADESFTSAAEIVHEIKGSGATFGARKLAAICRDLEVALADRSTGGVPSASAIAAEFERVAKALGGSFRTDSRSVTSEERLEVR